MHTKKGDIIGDIAETMFHMVGACDCPSSRTENDSSSETDERSRLRPRDDDRRTPDDDYSSDDGDDGGSYVPTHYERKTTATPPPPRIAVDSDYCLELLSRAANEPHNLFLGEQNHEDLREASTISKVLNKYDFEETLKLLEVSSISLLWQLAAIQRIGYLVAQGDAEALEYLWPSGTFRKMRRGLHLSQMAWDRLLAHKHVSQYVEAQRNIENKALEKERLREQRIANAGKVRLSSFPMTMLTAFVAFVLSAITTGTLFSRGFWAPWLLSLVATCATVTGVGFLATCILPLGSELHQEESFIEALKLSLKSRMRTKEECSKILSEGYAWIEKRIEAEKTIALPSLSLVGCLYLAWIVTLVFAFPGADQGWFLSFVNFILELLMLVVVLAAASACAFFLRVMLSARPSLQNMPAIDWS